MSYYREALGGRPRERLAAFGPSSLRDDELIALVLRTGNRRDNSVRLANRLLAQFDGLEGLLNQDLDALTRIHGLGVAKAAGIIAIRELANRAARARVEEAPVIAGSESVRRYLRLRMNGLEREVFGVLLLNTRNRLIGAQDLFMGSVDRAAVYPREVIKCVLARNASGVVLYHNHPSGNPEPSNTDIDLTRRLAALLAEIDVRLLDHIVVGDGRQVSLAERGLI